MSDIAIIGSGCAGLTAAIYTARANLNPTVFCGNMPGGQLTTTTDVENFPGFPEGIMGPELIMNMTKQAEKFGTKVIYENIESIKKDEASGKFILNTGEKEESFTSVIISSGASPRYLGIENEKSLIGNGLTSCATCDGAFYKNVPVCVVGGGDSACEEANFLTRFASKVYLIHRRDELRASKIMADRALNNPKIEPIWDTVINSYSIDENTKVNGVAIENLKNGEKKNLEISAVFMAIGHVPNTSFFKGLIELDSEGYIVVEKGTTKTNVPGVFAAGDVVDKVYKQAITAAGQGCMAALEAEHYISGL